MTNAIVVIDMFIAHNKKAMFNKSVIFDTNAYRQFTCGKDFITSIRDMEQLKLIEEKRQISAYMSPVTMMELFAHLSDTNDPHYDNCKNAIAVSYLHSKLTDNKNYRLLADPESLLVKLVFNQEIPGQMENCSYLGELAYCIYKNPDEKYIDSFRANFKPIAEHIKQSEINFINSIFMFVVQSNNPNAIDWDGIKNDDQLRKRFLNRVDSENFLFEGAKWQVKKACISIGIDYTSLNDIDERARAVLDVFPAPLHLYREILRKIGMSGLALDSAKKNKGNWLWDIMILHNCAKNSKFNDKEALLVTSDKEMIKAANNAGLKDKVMRLDDYIKKIN